ncbi:M20 metallopeptidase family protein [Jeotgalicoccus meleagridis]|jgi:amidohydrolase|uniref:Putative hydrolase YxeP n=1 Tax=Jeotgalicoccus meleagridis TaxID=2759181 RepID=A0A6V7RH85_9STAP|nr:M20 family metallopeptidase [Jeotgalicoccus meleagridis]CAD2076688.1 putative hydrolase YxeP [Jeotgalicoccus meleagridis]
MLKIEEKLIQDAIDFRRVLHQYPELSAEEVETSKRIQEKLKEYGIPFQTGFADTGILGIIKGEQEGKVIGIRADIDALPMEEISGVDFSSKNDGVMHACGHDAHTSMLIHAGKILNDNKKDLKGTILLIFQPAEELSPTGGSQRMMDDGVFNEYEPEMLLAQHVWPDLEVGKFGVMAGPIMGNSDKFKIIIKGSGGHASMPHSTTDALITANQVVNVLQTLVSRNANPMEPAVLTVGRFEAGTKHNVIAETAELEGTIRTQSDETKAMMKKRFFEVVENVVHSMGAECEIIFDDGYPATVNDERWASALRQSLVKLYGESAVPSLQPSLAGEDFSRFLQKYPGVYYWLGTSVGEGQKPLHNPAFRLNEDAFKYGITGMVNMAVDTLNALSEEA